LASRLREAGKYVLGMGEKKTPQPFISACEKFKYLEVLLQDFTPESSDEKSVKTSKVQLIVIIKSIIKENSDDDGWAFMGEIGNYISKRNPEFDTRNYGYQKLTPLISSMKIFEIQSRKTPNPNITHKYVRIKE